MDILEAFFLGIIQGLTEFLPVSSSGHLELGKALFGDQSLPEESLMFTVIVHFATAMSTVVVFRKQIISLVKGLFEFRNNESFRFSAGIVISMIPAAIVGLFFEDMVEDLFSGRIVMVGAMLIITGILLFLADKARNTGKPVSYLSALIIGIAQAIAIIPGISRSGATIATAVLLGIDRTKAASFSFLMVVPLIFGKIAKDLLSGAYTAYAGDAVPLITGFAAAFISGCIACRWMINLVRNSQLRWFAYYCFVIGAVAITLKVVQ